MEEGNKYCSGLGEGTKGVHASSSDEEDEVPDEGVGITHSTWPKPS
jgi:hypothetical protein